MSNFSQSKIEIPKFCVNSNEKKHFADSMISKLIEISFSFFWPINKYFLSDLCHFCANISCNIQCKLLVRRNILQIVIQWCQSWLKLVEMRKKSCFTNLQRFCVIFAQIVHACVNYDKKIFLHIVIQLWCQSWSLF